MWAIENSNPYARQGLRDPSDVTDAEWDLVRPFLVSSKHKGSPSPERVRAILNGVLDALSTGCQWRALPKDLPPQSTVHGWFVRWHCDGVRALGPVAKFVSELRKRRIGSAFRLGCPRMTVVKCGPKRPSPRPVSNFATGPSSALPFVRWRTSERRGNRDARTK